MASAQTDRPSSPPRGRLSREEWLEKALEILSREGEGKLRVDAICKAIGVTKGSFYWHFEGRADFLRALVDHWVAAFNRRVPETAEARGGSAMERLRCVFELVVENNLGKYDVAFDAWAAHEPEIAEQVKATYRYRYQYVRSLFHALGFRGIELETRTTAFLSFLKSEPWVTGRERPANTPRRINAELEFFTRR